MLQDELDAFRRGNAREQCAREAAPTWRPYKLFNITDSFTTNSRYSYLLGSGQQVVAVISAATAKLNEIRAQQPVVQQPPAATAPAQSAPAAMAAQPAAPTAPSGPASASPSAQPTVQAQQLG